MQSPRNEPGWVMLEILLKKRNMRIKFISVSLYEGLHAFYHIGEIREKHIPFWLLWPRIT
jgi:hypothetical protein